MATADPPHVSGQRRPSRPPLDLGSRYDICFYHPGYVTSNLLLTLPRVDCTAVADATSIYGIQHRIALLACQVIAGNTFDNSHFALDKDDQQRVQVPLDGVLTDNNYYFIVEGCDMYPIFPSFKDYQFPHDRFNVPDFWPPVTPTPTTTCGITNASFAIEEAHIVPQKERAWYEDNDMSRYGIGLPDINNGANIIPLRKDIHYCFDDRWFVIVPKFTKVGLGTPSFQYLTHIITGEAAELWPTYHNTLVESLHIRSPAYFFARFVWAILIRVKPFVIKGYSRQVIRIYRDNDGKIEYRANNYTGEMLREMYGGGGSQAATPIKRKSAPGSAMDGEERPVELSTDDSNNVGDVWDIMDDWRERERRLGSPDEAVPDTKVHLALGVEADLREALRKNILKQ